MSQYKDPYKPTTIMESKAGFFFVAQMKLPWVCCNSQISDDVPNFTLPGSPIEPNWWDKNPTNEYQTLPY